MHLKEFREEDPTSHLPALQGSVDQLNKNQKKKLRQKRSRLFKSTTATAGPSSVNQYKEQRQQLQGKRVKGDPNTTSVPKAVVSAEPHQQRPQYSLTSSDNPHSLARVPHQQQPGQIDVKEGKVETMPEPICRTDMTHAARNLVANEYYPGNDGTAAAAAAADAMAANLPPAQTLPIIEDSSPAGSIHTGGGSSARIKHNILPTESAASAEDNLQDLQDNKYIITVYSTKTVAAIAGSLSTFQTPPVPAPPLDVVAPTGPNGMRVYLHGNYHRYYGYRLGQEFSEDPRLALLERPWFSGKRCMDVGCNEGLVTLGIAMKFGSRSMIGVDIDEHLIKRACIHLREERSRAVVRAAEVRQGGTTAAERRAARTAVSALAQTWFVHGDFLEARAELGSIDCLTALSVTKWVHLHRGDQGLKAFFARVHSLLAPGGVFILEPQPWKSYRAAADKIRRQGGVDLLPLSSKSFFRRVGELELRPDQFPEVLENEFGFRLLRRLQPPEETAEGFDRPMFLFRKI